MPCKALFHACTWSGLCNKPDLLTLLTRCCLWHSFWLHQATCDVNRACNMKQSSGQACHLRDPNASAMCAATVTPHHKTSCPSGMPERTDLSCARVRPALADAPLSRACVQVRPVQGAMQHCVCSTECSTARARLDVVASQLQASIGRIEAEGGRRAFQIGRWARRSQHSGVHALRYPKHAIRQLCCALRMPCSCLASKPRPRCHHRCVVGRHR